MDLLTYRQRKYIHGEAGPGRRDVHEETGFGGGYISGVRGLKMLGRNGFRDK